MRKFMKRGFVLGLLLIVVLGTLAGCKSEKASIKDLDGTWELEDVLWIDGSSAEGIKEDHDTKEMVFENGIMTSAKYGYKGKLAILSDVIKMNKKGDINAEGLDVENIERLVEKYINHFNHDIRYVSEIYLYVFYVEDDEPAVLDGLFLLSKDKKEMLSIYDVEDEEPLSLDVYKKINK